jgi:SGNH hydrolase-like domain, acetyltransferase AlgX
MFVKNLMLLKKLLYFFPIAVIWHALFFYGLPIEGLLMLFGLAIVSCFFYQLVDMWIIAISLVLVTAILETVLSLTGLGTAMFFRPTEMLRVGSDEFGYVYKPNHHMTMISPFGDLDATLGIDMKEPREIEFVTDGLGFRNRQNYTGQKFFIVGDSFAMGEGSTQACVITEVMKNLYQQDVYNLAHSGNQPRDYLNHIESFTRLNPGHPKAIVMFFEGNDFERFQYQPYWTNISRPYQDFFRATNVFRYTRWLYLRATKPKDTGGGPIIKMIRGRYIAFSSWYASNVNRVEPLDEEYMQWSKFFDRLDGQIALIIFVPDKYRLYAPLLDTPPPMPLPNRNWEYLYSLAAEHKLPILNLTQTLATSAKKEIDRDQFIFWRGDTHWNCLGMAVASYEINKAINNLPKSARGVNE